MLLLAFMLKVKTDHCFSISGSYYYIEDYFKSKDFKKHLALGV